MHRLGIGVMATALIIVFSIFRSASFAEGHGQALIEAATQGDVAKVQELLEKGPDINAKGTCGVTALMWAAYKGHAGVIKALLAKGADINAKDNKGHTPMMMASLSGHAEVVKVLLVKGADIHAKDNDGMTALMWASSMGRTEVVKALLAKGADVNGEDKVGLTALMWASSMGRTEVVKALLAKGADVNGEDKVGSTALNLASQHNHLEVVRVLKAHGARETGDSKSLSDSDNWRIAVLLLIAFALIVFCKTASNRMMGGIFFLLGFAVWAALFSWFLTRRNDGTVGAIIGFIYLSEAIADLIAIPILKRRAICPCVRVRRTPIYKTIHSFFLIALGTLFLVVSFSYPRMNFVFGLMTASTVIYLIIVVSERVDVCANGISQYQGLRPWEEYESFSWKRKTDYGIELWIVPTSWRSWVHPSQRLLVAPEDREAVQQILEANLPDRSTAPGA